MSRTPMTPKMRDAILRSVGSEKDVAARLGVSKSTVGKLRRKHGVKPHGWDAIERQKTQAIAMRQAGATYQQIADEVGIGVVTAFNWCVSHGLPKVRKTYRSRAAASKPEVKTRGPAEWVLRALRQATKSAA